MAPVMDPIIVAYYTDAAGSVHAVCWCTIMSKEELVLACYPNWTAPGAIRTAENHEAITCLFCLAMELKPWVPETGKRLP